MTGTPPILTRAHVLDGGPTVALRLARPRDAVAVRALLAARGVESSHLDVTRLLGYDPARCLVLVAVLGLDEIVGIGAIDLEPGADVHTLVTDEERTPGLAELIGSVLHAQAQASARRAA